MFSWNSYVQLEPGPYASRFQRSLSHDPHAIRHWKAREEQKRILASYSNIVVQTQAIASCRKNKNCILQHRVIYDDMHQWSSYCWHSTMDSFLSRRSPGILMQVRTCRELWRKKYRRVDCNIWKPTKSSNYKKSIYRNSMKAITLWDRTLKRFLSSHESSPFLDGVLNPLFGSTEIHIHAHRSFLNQAGQGCPTNRSNSWIAGESFAVRTWE